MKKKAIKNINKNILLVANSTWNIYNFRLNVIDKFISEGYKVTVMAPIDQYLEYKEKYPQIEHYTIRTLDRDGTNPIRDAILIGELVRKYRNIQPDVVIHYTNKPNIYGAIAAKLVGIKSIGIVTGLGYPFIRKGWIRKITGALYKFSSKFHEMVIFENQEDRELFIKSGIIPKEKGISIKGCGVNMEFFQPRENPNKKKTTIFTFIGRLLYDKGIREFVKSAEIVRKNHQNVEFWVVGELDPNNPATVDKEELGKWVNSKAIQYFGFQQDVRPIIAQSNCIVLPSYREAIPRTITEGMAMAKPVITTDTAGCREAVEHDKNGFLVNVQEVTSLVDGIEKFLLLPIQKQIEMGEYGRQKAMREFDDQKIAEDIFKITEKVLNG